MSYIWRDPAGMSHWVTHINKEKRAGRIACGQYIEFWPPDVSEDAMLTCLICIGTTEEDVGRIERVENIDRDVNERGDDVVMRCNNHLYHKDEDGRCSRCGYYHRMEFK